MERVTVPAKGGELLEREHGLLPVGRDLRARDRNGAETHTLISDSRVQGCPRSVMGFLNEVHFGATRNCWMLRSWNRRRRAAAADRAIFLKDKAKFGDDFSIQA